VTKSKKGTFIEEAAGRFADKGARLEGFVMSIFFSVISYKFRRVSGNNSIRQNIFGDQAAGADDRILPDSHIAQNSDTRADGCSLSHNCRFDLPVCLCLEPAACIDRTRVFVIDEDYAMTDEYVILDGDTLADKGMALYLAVLSDMRILLDLDKGSDLCIVADRAAVKIDEFGELYVPPEDYIG
jgi:hypothetical protein